LDLALAKDAAEAEVHRRSALAAEEKRVTAELESHRLEAKHVRSNIDNLARIRESEVGVGVV
jgi:hypothetical protein